MGCPWGAHGSHMVITAHLARVVQDRSRRDRREPRLAPRPLVRRLKQRRQRRGVRLLRGTACEARRLLLWRRAERGRGRAGQVSERALGGARRADVRRQWRDLRKQAQVGPASAGGERECRVRVHVGAAACGSGWRDGTEGLVAAKARCEGEIEQARGLASRRIGSREARAFAQ
eukprot:1568003-Prymnesium_polylepis.2